MNDTDTPGALSPAGLARRTGVSTDTLRHYERVGVLPAAPRCEHNGYRRYPPEAEARVLLVRRALRLGFTLEELARLLRARDRGGAPCRDARELAARKLGEVEARLCELAALRDDLRAALADWDARLDGAGGAPARLLESLGGEPTPKGTRPEGFRGKGKTDAADSG